MVQLFDPDLINLPPVKYRPIWLLTDHDETDTNYSLEIEDHPLDQSKGAQEKVVKGAEKEGERADGSVPIPREDAQELKEVERPRPDGEHTGVG